MLLLILVFSSGCVDDQGSKASILFVNEKKYYGHEFVKENQYVNLVKVGEVKTKVNKIPEKNFFSNSLEEGVPIYKVEDQSFLLVKHPDGKYQIFRDDADKE